MEDKLIEFNEGGFFKLSKDDEDILVAIQARHLGKEFKITSTNARLNKDEVKEIIQWLQQFIAEVPNE